MALFPAVTGLGLILEDDHLVIAAVSDHLSDDPNSLHEGLTDLYVAITSHQEDISQVDGSSNLGR